MHELLVCTLNQSAYCQCWPVVSIVLDYGPKSQECSAWEWFYIPPMPHLCVHCDRATIPRNISVSKCTLEFLWAAMNYDVPTSSVFWWCGIYICVLWGQLVLLFLVYHVPCYHCIIETCRQTVRSYDGGHVAGCFFLGCGDLSLMCIGIVRIPVHHFLSPVLNIGFH